MYGSAELTGPVSLVNSIVVEFDQVHATFKIQQEIASLQDIFGVILAGTR